MKTLETVTIKLKKYPTYMLCGKVLKEDYEKYLKTKDESLILYKYCVNNIHNPNINYRKIMRDKKHQERKEYLNFRKSLGYKST
jgi:hypothetical protein